MDRDAIHAAGFRRIAELMNSDLSAAEKGMRTMSTVEQILGFVERHKLVIAEQLALLQATRWCRLPRTQFCYWPERSDPKMVHPNGTYDYVRVNQRHTVGVPDLEQITQVLLEYEAQNFDTEDEMVIWWRGWQILMDPNGGLTCVCDVGETHIYDGDVHHERRTIATTFPKVGRTRLVVNPAVQSYLKRNRYDL